MVVIGIDIGGTFTDFVVHEPRSRRTQTLKVPSAPGEEWRSVVRGIQLLGVDLRRPSRVTHATTVGTNAVLERRGAVTAMVTTEGFRDVIEVGRGQRLIPGTLFHIKFKRLPPLVPRARRFEVRERMLANGKPLTSLDEASVRSVIEAVTAVGCESVAVCLLHAYANPAHEAAIRAALRQALPNLHISLSHEVVSEYREFERFSTTVMNAYVAPHMRRYLGRLEEALTEHGYRGRLHIMGANGGVMMADAAEQLAVRTILSGPVGGVNGALYYAARAGYRHIVTYDMGGTSTDVCLVRNGRPGVAATSLVGGFPLKLAQLPINTVGAGGGSIAWVDEAGLLQVGPQSAGARPGPACYGLGGTDATVTDANVVLGRIGSGQRLGGALEVRRELATAAMQKLAGALGGLGTTALAEGIVRIAVGKMASAIRAISIEKGHDPREYVLVPYGGAGPMHAAFVAEEIGITEVLVPPYPGNVSAFGLLVSDLTRDLVQTWIVGLRDLSAADLQRRFAAMRAELTRLVAADGWGCGRLEFRYVLDLRYRGQAFELTIPLASPRMAVADVAAAFDAAHLEAYGHNNPGAPVEVVTIRVAAVRRIPRLDPPPSPRRAARAARPTVRPVYFGSRVLPCPVVERDALPPRWASLGPVIVEESGSTTVVPPDWTIRVDTHGNLRLHRRSRTS
jgi:N-methylhydantoinase A